MLFHAHGQHLFLRQRNGFIGRAHKARNAADIPHQMPGVVRHDHLNEHIAGEHLALDFLGGAGLGDLRHGLQGNLDPQDLILHVAPGDELFNAGLNGIFIPGIGMDDIPLRAV